jgi:hypothetical protein
MRYQELVRFGTVQRRIESLAQELAGFAEQLNATICALAHAPKTGLAHEFWDQYERDVDRRLDELRTSQLPE